MATRVFGLLPLARSLKHRQRTDTKTSLAASDCVWPRSKITNARKNFRCLNFRSFYFRVRDGAYEIYEN